ncbi:uncharacterized protein LOC142144452 [Mixophyes fleayi]|uniref:uncharacterized protein LOC142144452 n=1 Tax=Mixophyes fleayi TaxID=3061075 RepID=UPI003F4D9192
MARREQSVGPLGQGYSEWSGQRGREEDTSMGFTPLDGGGWDLGSRSGETEFREAPQDRPVFSSTCVTRSGTPPDTRALGNTILNLTEAHNVFSSASQGHDSARQEQRVLHDEPGAAVGRPSPGAAESTVGPTTARTEERLGVEQASGAGMEVEAAGDKDHHAGIRGLAECGLAQSSLRVYRAAWRQWVQFSTTKDQSEAGHRHAVMEYMWLKFCEGASKASMSSTLERISFMSRLNRVVDMTKGFLISKALKGWAKERPTSSDTRHLITPQILTQLMRVLVEVTWDEYEVLLFRIAFSLAFFGAFRVSELVGQAAGHGPTGLLTENVVIREDHLSCKIASSKTDQRGRGCWLHLQAQKDKGLCPVELATQFSLIRPVNLTFLIHRDKAQLTRYQLNAVLKKAIKLLGFNPSFFSSHSFRIGAATSAALAGALVESIKALWRWKSEA